MGRARPEYYSLLTLPMLLQPRRAIGELALEIAHGGGRVLELLPGLACRLIDAALGGRGLDAAVVTQLDGAGVEIGIHVAGQPGDPFGRLLQVDGAVAYGERQPAAFGKLAPPGRAARRQPVV